MIRSALAGLAFSLTASAASADFVLDLDAPTLRRRMERPAVEDMAVGEKGFVSFPTFCRDEGTLFIFAQTLLLTARPASEYSGTYEVNREPEGRVSLRLSTGSAGRTPDRTILHHLMPLFACDTMDIARDARLIVSSLNGVASLSELLGD